MAAVLGVRLGGVNRYDGVPSPGPEFNPEGRPATSADLAASVRWMWRVTLLSAAGLGIDDAEPPGLECAAGRIDSVADVGVHGKSAGVVLNPVVHGLRPP